MLTPNESLRPMPAARKLEKFHVKTFGCQMNVADTERMNALLSEGGMTATEDPSEADLIVINGCSVREKAVHKAVSYLGTTQALSKDPILAIGGCVGQLAQDSLFKGAPYLDFVFGPDTIDQLPELVHRASQGDRHFVSAEFDPTLGYTTTTKVMGQPISAFVNIMKGCDKYCTYCIVPFTRGREKSRSIDEVLEDLAGLVAKGVREVTLLGQNVNSFGKGNANTQGRMPLELTSPIGKVGPRKGDENFPQLLHAIENDPRLKLLKRVRYTSSHPLDFSDELLQCHATPEKGGLSKLAPHLHLPVQSGSNTVLQKMGRHHKIETYIEQMDRLKALNPDIGLSTDLIVGFPGETEADFEETLRLLDRIQYDNIYAFAYSVRPGTRAAKMPDDVSKKTKAARLNHLLDYQMKIAERRYAERVGKVYEVLVEGEAKTQALIEKNQPELAAEGAKVWTGKTACNRVVNFISYNNRNLKNYFLPIQITHATSLSLLGKFVEGELL